MAARTTPSTTAAGSKSALSLQTFSAFESRPFRLLWVNAFTFSLAQSIRQFSFVWLALEVGGSGQALGLVSFALGIPILLFVLPAGALTDRMDRRVLLFGSQAAALLVTAGAAVMVWADQMTTPATFGFALALGATVEPARLLNAVTLTGLGQNVSMIAGPVAVGRVIDAWGVGGAFAMQAVLLALGLIALVPLRVPAHPVTAVRRRLLPELREGLSYTAHHPGIRTLLLALLATSLIMAGTFTTLLPKIAKEDLLVSAFAASLLFGAMGAGMLGSSLLLASLTRMQRVGLWFIATLICGGALNAFMGLSPVYWLSLTLMFITGWNAGFFTNLNLTLIQSNTPQHVMGRVMAIYTLCMAGAQPIGALVAGQMADVIGAREWFVTCGVAFFAFGVAVFLTQPHLREMRAGRIDQTA
jgi:MFS family permease